MKRKMKGYGVDSILERTAYSKLNGRRLVRTKNSILEQKVYGCATNAGRKSWGNVRRKKIVDCG